jgi:hypothetical protein
MTEITTKICHACKVEKPAKDFYKSSSSKDGYAPSCKDCQNGRTPKTTPTKQPSKHQTIPVKEKPFLEQTSEEQKETHRKHMERFTKNGGKAVLKTVTIKTGELDGDFAKFWDDPERSGKTLHAGKMAWWHDPDRDEKWRRFPRAVSVISVNQTKGTAMISYFKDPSAMRVEDHALVNLEDLRWREIP